MLIPLILIVILLMCLMNNENDGFSVGGQCPAGNKLDGDGFNVGGQPSGVVPNGDSNLGRINQPSGNAPNGNAPNGNAPNGNAPNGNAPNGNAPNGNAPNGNAPNGNAPNGNAPNGNAPNGNAPNGNTCKVTMVWADWCGFSKKAKPEWDNLVKEMSSQNINGYNLQFKDAEEKVDPETVKEHGTKGFPTYYVELSDKPGQKEEFNSIKKDDMLQKIKGAITKLSGGTDAGPEPERPEPERPEPERPEPDRPEPDRPEPDKGAQALIQQANQLARGPSKFANSYNSIRPTVYGELLFSSCNNEYGPLRLDSVDRNLAGVGNQKQEVVGKGDCTSLEFAPIKSALGKSQLPSIKASIPSLAQLQTPGIDSIQGIIRPSSFDTPVAQPNAVTGGDSGKTATVTMVWADWCGYSNKAKPEWDSLVNEVNNTDIDGCKVQLRDLEQKKDESEIKNGYSDVNGFPTYVVEVTDPSGKLLHKGDFNSIKKDDMLQKIKAEIAKA